MRKINFLIQLEKDNKICAIADRVDSSLNLHHYFKDRYKNIMSINIFETATMCNYAAAYINEDMKKQNRFLEEINI